MAAPRGEFSSKFGFVLAAAGSAVGLGNIWGFPTQAASNGGAAFLIVYLIMAFCLAYPALMAELTIGRHGKANSVDSLRMLGNSAFTRNLGMATGFAGMITASLILSFYGIVAGWMLANFLAPAAELAGMDAAAAWMTDFGVGRNLVFMVIFMILTIAIVCAGVQEGIERWSTRLMPALFVLMFLLIVYVMTLDGASDGLRAYLIPDFSRATDVNLYVSAMGQAFFSMSLGVGTMLIYGSYIGKRGKLVSLGRSVTLLDIGIAVAAGLLIMPAMYVAQANGVPIYDEAGTLVAGDTLIVTVLPALFDTMGGAGIYVGIAFFILMSIAAVTSSISMLEVSVAYTVEKRDVSRHKATYVIGGLITVVSAILVLNFEKLFGLTVVVATQYSQPILGLLLCVFVGWIWHRDSVLRTLKHGTPDIEAGWFWKIWPAYVRYVCPAAILLIFYQRFTS